MNAPFGQPLLIVNPAAGVLRGEVIDRLRAALDDAGMTYDMADSGGRGDATRIARAAVADGRRLLVAVGGDGTVNEVVNGMFDPLTGRPRAEGIALGVVGGGSGSDFARTFGLDRPAERMVAHLQGESTMRVDVGRVRCMAAGGTPTTRLFVNVAQAGFGAHVAATAARLPRRLGSARYRWAIAAGWPRFRRVMTSVTVDGGRVTEPLCDVVVANGQFFGGGLHVAPRAIPSDGRFHVQAIGGSLRDIVHAARQLADGSHLERDDVRAWASSTAAVHTARAVPVEVDGELIGTTPATFDILPGALALKM